MTGLLHRSQNNLPSVNRRCASPPTGPSSGREPGSKMDYHQTAPASEKDTTGSTGQAPSVYPAGHGQPSGGACAYPPEQEGLIFDTDQFSDDMDRSGSVWDLEDGQLSDSTEPPEQAEDMTYRETVRSVRAFMGWHYIPTFEKSNNPWKGKHPKKPTRISVAMPPDDWLCQKLERLNLTVAEGYPSWAQDSGSKMDYHQTAPASEKDTTGSTGQAPSVYPAGHGQPSGGACAYPPEQEGLIFDTDQFSDDMDRSGSVWDLEDGQLSDSTEPPEQAEDMTYRETVRSVRAFMGWHYIPTFENIQNQINPIIPGRANTRRSLLGYRWPCPQMIGYAKSWNV